MDLSKTKFSNSTDEFWNRLKLYCLHTKPIKGKQKTMTVEITFSDLISVLRKASSNPHSHADAQRSYFSDLKEDSVLTRCGTACCVAGDMILRAHADSSEEEVATLIEYWSYTETPWEWVKDRLGLTEVEAILAFDINTHHEIHAQLADLLEQGLRLPDDEEMIELSYGSTYTEFECAYLDHQPEALDLDEVLSWMRGIAQ
jgi:hypothetical protein